MTCEEREWYNVTQAAEYLGVSRDSIYKLMDGGDLPYYEVKGLRARRIRREDLDALMRRIGGEDEEGNSGT